MECYRVVLSCWDYGNPESYSDAITRFFDSELQAREAIAKSVADELKTLNSGREKVPVEDSDGKVIGYDYDFRADENGNHANVIRFWDGDDYQNVTAYDVHKLTSDAKKVSECSYVKYRGFWVLPNKNHSLFYVEQHDTRLTSAKSLTGALDWIDEFHLAFEEVNGRVSRPAPLVKQIEKCAAQVHELDNENGPVDRGTR